MIYYNPRQWFSLIFQFHRSDTFRILLPSMVMVGLYTALVTYLALEVWGWKSGTTTVHSLLGVVLGLVLVFRTNTAYERWWEGRKLWGTLVNETRSLAIKLNAFRAGQRPAHAPVFRPVDCQLRAGRQRPPAPRGESPTSSKKPTASPGANCVRRGHVPNRIAASIYAKCNQLYTEGRSPATSSSCSTRRSRRLPTWWGPANGSRTRPSRTPTASS
jgi:putative membrane protein